MKNSLKVLSFILCCSTVYGGGSINLGKTEIYSETGYKTNLRSTISSPVVITSKEIEEKGYTTLSEVLASIPNVNVNEGIRPAIDIRGQGYQKSKATVQLLIDGVAANMLDTSHMNVPINMINPKQIEKIEILPGGGAVLYGSGTAGGVINVITKRNKGTYGNIGYRYGSYKNNKYDVSVGTSMNNFDFNFDYSKNKKNDYRRDANIDSDYFSGRLTYHINDTDDISLKYTGYRANYKDVDSLTEEEMKKDRRQNPDTSTIKEKNKIKKDEFTLNYNGKMGEKNELNISSYYQNTELPSESLSDSTNMYMGMLMGQKSGLEKGIKKIEDMGMIPPPMKKGLEAMKKRLSYVNSEITKLRRGGKAYFYSKSLFKDTKKGIKIKNKFNYGNGSNLILGVGYLDNDMKRDSLMKIVDANSKDKMTMADIKIDLEKKTYEVFGINTYKLGKFELSQGLRYEKSKYNGKRYSTGITSDINRSMSNVAGMLAANYLYSDTGNIYAKYERAFTSPAPGQLTDKVKDKRGTISYVVNNLKSEKTNLFEIGWNEYLFNSLIGASVYYSETKDEIVTVFAGGIHHPTNTFENLNIGKTRRYGFDIRAEQKIDNFRITEAYSYINTKIIEDKENKSIEGKKIPNIPAHKFSLSVDYDINEKFALGADYEYKAASFINYKNTNGKDKAKSVINLRANYKVTENINLYGGIRNLFDSKYYNSISESENKKLYSPAETRNYYVGFDYKF